MILSVDSDDGIIKIGSPPEEIPGFVESIRISDTLLIENADIQGRSGKVKVVQGWDDVAMLVTLSLIDNPEAGKTRWDSLKEITAIFKKVGANGKPEVYTVSHPMIAAWGTKDLLISSLESSENRTRRKISVSIEFIEHDSSVGIIQERQTPDAPAGAAQTAPAPLVSDQQRRGLGQLEERFASI